ncbi:uncharacterized protein B0P05DRAFT_538014 [Gilbertella persicaria]|uniref:uncharacterized protein n=1 Tax=Gilbertella persicaria TaxID=101096 RepID=UPI00221E3862|nr:uncharacterized protein B0P05DRAFT_538014 [Gilbertella persicaria]KAI8082678.1 hypothetical protein B0P05DRAFT_538014 [Gilbertella persicaria]
MLINAILILIFSTLCTASTSRLFKYLGDTPYQNQSSVSSTITTPLRIQRDLGANVTIDQLIWPTLSLSSAYFQDNYSFARLSGVRDILDMGYKRLILDIYWDQLDWQLCPFPLQSIPDDTTCSSNATLAQFLSIVNEYLVSTETARMATKTDLVFIVLNLHDLSTNTNTTDSNLAEIIQNSISNTTSAPRIYTPFNLTTDRLDMNLSFFANGRQSYFLLLQQQQSNVWPQWLYLIQNNVQLLVGFGTLPTGKTSYRLTSLDNHTIFDSTSLVRGVTFQSCPQNHSWAFASDMNQTSFTYTTAVNVTECGYSPYFTSSNYSTNKSIASDFDRGHLADNILSTIWSWDINEPQANKDKRCAAMLLHNGRWKATDCSEQYRVACRSLDDPDTWMITQDIYSYDRSMTSCPDNYTFDVPHIPRQNTILKRLLDQTDIEQDRVWINLNWAYNEDSCWVIGRYGTCWWADDNGQAFLGLIRTSVVSGVIILILVGIFTWVKCARLWRNRNSKSRKAMVKKMLAKREYVTIPA